MTQSPPPGGCRQPRWPRREHAAAAGCAACSVNVCVEIEWNGEGAGLPWHGRASKSCRPSISRVAGWGAVPGWVGMGRAEQWNGAGQGCRGRGLAPFPFHRKPRHSPPLLRPGLRPSSPPPSKTCTPYPQHTPSPSLTSASLPRPPRRKIWVGSMPEPAPQPAAGWPSFRHRTACYEMSEMRDEIRRKDT